MNAKIHHEMTALLRTFPVLEQKLAYWPQSVAKDRVVRDAYEGASSGERCVIDFLLSVWDPQTDWAKRGYANFNLVKAMGILSGGRDVDALIAWIRRPWRP